MRIWSIELNPGLVRLRITFFYQCAIGRACLSSGSILHIVSSQQEREKEGRENDGRGVEEGWREGGGRGWEEGGGGGGGGGGGEGRR